MKNFLIAFVVFAVWTFFALWLYSLIKSPESFSLNRSDNGQSEPADTEQQVNIDTLTTSLQDTIDSTSIAVDDVRSEGLIGKNSAGLTVFYFEDGLQIKRNDSLVYTTPTNIDYKYKVLNYLLEHPDSQVTIVSKYSANEDFKTPNYGVTRGEFIKDQLIDAGVTRELIVVKPVIQDIDFDSQQQYSSGISFKFEPIDEERIAALANEIPKNKVVYPTFTNSGIFVNNELKQMLEELKEVMAERPEITVKVVGHTDNIGNYQDNYNLGLKYARQVRWYFISKGNLDRTRILAVSKGESEPVDTNNTQRGRDMNRRIEIIYN